MARQEITTPQQVHCLTAEQMIWLVQRIQLSERTTCRPDCHARRSQIAC